ncbi:MAG: CoA pyrophosphatase [Eubacteriales bacterium]
MILPKHPKPMNSGKCYALFVPIVAEEEGLALVYERRSAKLRRQPSEICFPGGRMEEGETVVEAAVREMKEELGVSPQEIYGETDFLIHRNGDIIYPVLGKITPPYVPYPEEVEKVFSVPISVLKSQHEAGVVLLGAELESPVSGVPEHYPFQRAKDRFSVYRWEGEVIWGITGKITNHILKYLD